MVNQVYKYKIRPHQVLISGIGQATDTNIVFEGEDITILKALRICSNQVYTMAKKNPEDIDVCEAHDALSILEAEGLINERIKLSE